MSAPAGEGKAAVDARGLSAALADDLIAYRAGDQAAADRLARRATPILWHVARSCGADAMAAEDAVQNGMLALVRWSDSIQEPRAVLKWLIVTVRREAIRLRRIADETALTPDLDTDLPAPHQSEPDDLLLVHDRARLLWQAVASLSARCQQLLRVVAFADRPDYRAIGEALHMPIGTIGPTRGRCLAKLRAVLAADPRWAGA